MSDLFRTEAVEHYKYRSYGEVILTPRLSHTVLAGILLIWVFAVAMWLLNGSYARKQSALGWIEPSKGIIRVYPLDNGVVQKVLVKEGDHVIKGQPLITIYNARTLQNGTHLESKLIEEYEKQSKFLNDQLESAQKNLVALTDNIEQQTNTAKLQIESLNQQLSSVASRHQLIEKQVDKYTALRKSNFVSSIELDNIISQELSIRGEKQKIQNEMIATDGLINKLASEKKSIIEENESQISKIKNDMSKILQQSIQLDSQESYTLRAPQEGTVNNLQATEGLQMNNENNIPVLTINPDNTELMIQLLVPVRAVGFIQQDQTLKIRYDAFPFQQFGTYSGKVIQVSNTLLLPNELLHTPISVNEPAYRVTASLEQSQVTAFGKSLPLKPGMTLSADILLDDRSLIQWLFEPIFSLKGRL